MHSTTFEFLPWFFDDSPKYKITYKFHSNAESRDAIIRKRITHEHVKGSKNLGWWDQILIFPKNIDQSLYTVENRALGHYPKWHITPNNASTSLSGDRHTTVLNGASSG